jgi:hypothetical protein
MPAGAHQLKFFVYIVESPSAPDLYHGRSEGHLVAQAIGLDLIPCVTRTAINPEAFIAALRIGLPEAMNHFVDRVPILHLSAHGGFNGIQLSSGTEVAWHHLRQLLLPINEGLAGTLLLCMSACEGYSACRMAMNEGEGPHPYLAMVGNYGKPTWSDTAVAYSAFYHLLAKGYFIPEAVEAMKAASGDDRWAMGTAEELKRSYIEYIREVEPAQARRELESAAQGADIPPSAKALEAPNQ